MKIRKDVFITIYAGIYEVEAENLEEAKEKMKEMVSDDYSGEDITEYIIG
ncbi:MAG: hypothetical protein RSE41_06915 [Clostridia bacterium]